jgi:hypothetical protein
MGKGIFCLIYGDNYSFSDAAMAKKLKGGV